MAGVPDSDFRASGERSRRRREEARAARRRRQRRVWGFAAAALGAFVLGAAVAASGGGGGGSDDDRADSKPPPPPPELPGGGRTVFPGRRIVAFYGTPGTTVLGTLGQGTAEQAARRVARQARAYERRRTPVLPAFELIGTVAASSPGTDGLYRNQRPLSEARRYLRAIRRVGGLLIIDVQPGRADFRAEVRRFAPLLREPDVSLALDPEWSMEAGEIPGQSIGHTDAATVNEISRWLAGIVKRGRLPQKLLVIHQFTPDMIRDRPAIALRKGLALTINVDGFGDQANKRAKYRELAPRRRFHPGFKLFYTQDTDMLTPRETLRLRPAPVLVNYQ